MFGHVRYFPKQIYTGRKLNLPLINSIHLVFLPLEMERKLFTSGNGWREDLNLTKVYFTIFVLSEKKRLTNL